MTAAVRAATGTDDKSAIGLAVPHAVTDPERVPAARYYDEQFFQLERERLWTRTWQQACRLEEIPEPGDFATSTFTVARQTANGIEIGEEPVQFTHVKPGETLIRDALAAE